jgi:hypothetical protein
MELNVLVGLAGGGGGTPALDTISRRLGFFSRLFSIARDASNIPTAYPKNSALLLDTLSVHLYSLNLVL